MEPMSYWPVELALDCTILYLLANSKNVYEIAFLGIAFIIHVTRQWNERALIQRVSSRKSPLFLIALLFGSAAVIWSTRALKWPVQIWIAIIAGVAYFWSVMAFVKDSGKRFTLFDPKIDVPQTIISACMTWIAFKNQNPVSILWLTDFTYHVLEATVT